MTRHRHSRVLSIGRAALLLPALFAAETFAAVAKNEAHGFVSVHEVEIAAPPERVWEALVEEVDEWWDPAHTYSGDANNMEFGALGPLGGLWEDLDDGSGSKALGAIRGIVRHMDFDMVRPPKTLRLRGALGPLQPLAVVGSMTFDLEAMAATSEAAENGNKHTRLAYRYVVNGPQLRDWAEPVDRVMGEQLQRLRRFVEIGEPTAATDDEVP